MSELAGYKIVPYVEVLGDEVGKPLEPAEYVPVLGNAKIPVYEIKPFSDRGFAIGLRLEKTAEGEAGQTDDLRAIVASYQADESWQEKKSWSGSSRREQIPSQLVFPVEMYGLKNPSGGAYMGMNNMHQLMELAGKEAVLRPSDFPLERIRSVAVLHKPKLESAVSVAEISFRAIPAKPLAGGVGYDRGADKAPSGNFTGARIRLAFRPKKHLALAAKAG